MQAKYIAPKSPKEVNIDSKQRATLVAVKCDGAPATAAPVPAATAFDDAHREIFALMRKDSFVRFKSRHVHNCPGAATVDAEIASYAAIQDAFCQEEGKAFATRDAAGKARVNTLLRAHFKAKCDADSKYVVPVPPQ